MIDHKPLASADRAFLRSNLVRLADIARRTERTPTTVNSWTKRYPDWPEPVVPSADAGHGGLYWWPEVEEFLENHKLPGKARNGQKFTSLFGKTLEPVPADEPSHGYHEAGDY